MVAIKAHQAESFLAKLDPRMGAVLFHGPDAGLVAERGHRLARRLAETETPAGEILRFDDADFEDDTGHLAIELRTIPMFGGRKIVRATPGRRLNVKVLEPLVKEGPLAGFLIVEAGNLRPDEALRALFEKAPAAAAVPCYADESKDLETVVREELHSAGLKITPEARELLVSRLGADRVLSRREIEKLALYAFGKSEIRVEDVEAIVGDASELALDKIPQAAISGEGARASHDFHRAVAAGESPQAIIAATQRYGLRLHRLRAEIDMGRSFDDAVRRLRPPPHWKTKDALARQCRQWTGPRLARALSIIAAAAKAARLAGPLEDTIAERLLLDLAGLAREDTTRRAS